jgi:hypothetical protein
MLGRILGPDEIMQEGDLLYWREGTGHCEGEDKKPTVLSPDRKAFIGKTVSSTCHQTVIATRPNANETALLKYFNFVEP